MKLTKWEKEFLLDRLETDVIPGVLVDTYGDITWAEAESAQKVITIHVKSGEIPIPWLTKWEREVLCDAIDGSTWFARLGDAVDNGYVTRQQFTADERRLDALIAKLSLAGLDVERPNME